MNKTGRAPMVVNTFGAVTLSMGNSPACRRPFNPYNGIVIAFCSQRRPEHTRPGR